jgi:regulator of sigma E protease
VSWLLALLGFVLLVILHEAGHFAAAKAVGMRVERFSLFFPPLLVRKQIGETEYAIGAIPLGGYVKISGMNPDEKLPDDVRTRAYYAQPAWKRIVVIAAGPAVNFVLALILLFVFFWQVGPREVAVDQTSKGFPAAGVLHAGDVVVSVDGHRGSPAQLSKLIAAHRCAVKPPVPRCPAATPARIVIRRKARYIPLSLRPVYDPKVKKMRVGFVYGESGPHQSLPFGQAVDTTLSRYWYFTRESLKLPIRILDPAKRKQITGTVGAYEVTRQTIKNDAGQAIGIIALISLSLAIVNLFPFLPLDGGHIFWAIVEKVRRKPVPFSVMERASVFGFALVLGLFFIGLSNDIGRITGEGFRTR